jgi:hypothetical protein
LIVPVIDKPRRVALPDLGEEMCCREIIDDSVEHIGIKLVESAPERVSRPPSRPRGNKMKDTAATRLATPRIRAATPRPFPGRADGGAASGCADRGS